MSLNRCFGAKAHRHFPPGSGLLGTKMCVLMLNVFYFTLFVPRGDAGIPRRQQGCVGQTPHLWGFGSDLPPSPLPVVPGMPEILFRVGSDPPPSSASSYSNSPPSTRELKWPKMTFFLTPYRPPKWPKVTQNGLKWPKMPQNRVFLVLGHFRPKNGRKWQKICCTNFSVNN